MLKRVERLLGLLGFLKLAKAMSDIRALTLDVVLDDKAVCSFLDWLEHARSASEGTRAEDLSALVSAVKFLYRDVDASIKGVRCSRVTVVERYKDIERKKKSAMGRLSGA